MLPDWVVGPAVFSRMPLIASCFGFGWLDGLGGGGLVGDTGSDDKTLVGLDLGAGNGPAIVVPDTGCGGRCVVGCKGEHEGGSATVLVGFWLAQRLHSLRTRWSKD